MRQPHRAEAASGRPLGRGSEKGFALILALLALMLLTFLGLTLATSTSTELRIATNYRWQQQALYNAEAGVEVGRALLRGMDWQSILPPVRGTPWVADNNPSSAGGGITPTRSRNDEWGNATRNFESWNCDKKGNGMGYGVVLDDGGTGAPYQYKTTVLGQTLNGAFTLWVRRPTLTDLQNGTVGDYTGDSAHLVLVAEGVAPYSGGTLSNTRVAGNAAVQVVEVLLSRATGTAPAVCGTRTGQAGQGPEGSGFASCEPITGAGLAAALGTAGQGGRGTYADQNVQ